MSFVVFHRNPVVNLVHSRQSIIMCVPIWGVAFDSMSAGNLHTIGTIHVFYLEDTMLFKSAVFLMEASHPTVGFIDQYAFVTHLLPAGNLSVT
jgi:hypothetical protein